MNYFKSIVYIEPNDNQLIVYSPRGMFIQNTEILDKRWFALSNDGFVLNKCQPKCPKDANVFPPIEEAIAYAENGKYNREVVNYQRRLLGE